MSQYFLGIDIGGSKSQALIADESGQALGLGEGGAGNHEDVGYDGLAHTLRGITEQALSRAGIRRDQIVGAGFGVAGYDWPSQLEPTLAAIRLLGLSRAAHQVVNDTIIGLIAGSANGWGVGVVAGTRCNAWGWDQERRVGRMTGMGLRMGEAAGAIELVEKSIEVIACAWTRRGPATRLGERLMHLVGASSVPDLLEGLSLGYYHLGATAAPVVFEVAAEGDPVATDLVLWAGRGLGSLAIGVIRQLGIESLTFDVVLIGSFYKGSPLLVETMRQTIQAVAPKARLSRLTVPPVLGGVLLGMEQVGLSLPALRAKVIQSTVELMRGHS